MTVLGFCNFSRQSFYLLPLFNFPPTKSKNVEILKKIFQNLSHFTWKWDRKAILNPCNFSGRIVFVKFCLHTSNLYPIIVYWEDHNNWWYFIVDVKKDISLLRTFISSIYINRAVFPPPRHWQQTINWHSLIIWPFLF